MFYSLALGLFVFLLLSLTIIYFRQASASEERLIELSFMHKMNDLDHSIKDVFLEIIGSKPSIDFFDEGENGDEDEKEVFFYLTDNAIVVEEYSPISLSDIDYFLNDTKSKIEADFSNVNIHLDEFSTNHNFKVQPYNINYNHVNENTVRVDGNSYIAGYDIKLYFLDNVSCDHSSTSGGTIDVDFQVVTPGSGCSYSLDDVSDAGIEININTDQVILDIASNGELVIENNNTAMLLNISTLINNPVGDAYIQLPIAIELDEPAFNFHKKSYIEVPSLSEN